MLSSSLINFTGYTMSHRGTSSPSRKKLPKSRTLVPSSPDSTDKMKRVSSTTLNTSKVDRSKDQSKPEAPNNSRIPQSTELSLCETEPTINGQQSPVTRSPDKTKSPERPNVNESDDDLVVMLTRQIYLAENQMQKMKSVLKRAEERLRTKDQEVVRLKRKVKDWEAKSKNQDTIHKKEMLKKKMEIENSAYLYKRCLSLEHKIFEMEKFLADYGLVWIGDSKTDSAKRHDLAPNDLIKNCYAQLTANIEELNMSVGMGEIHVQRNHDGGGASFKTPSCMCLRFYKNGMVIEEGKLRSYNEPNTVSFIRDILDGYFPSELQKAYPHGVPFKVEDHRSESYLLAGVGFPGHGYRLGKQHMLGPRSSTTTAVKSTIVANVQSPKSPSIVTENQKKCSYNFKTGMPSVPSSARPSKQRICSASTSADLLDLRSQILASHNNNCSYSHLQSHINAELGIDNRNERKRIPATKTTEYHMSMNERTSSSRGSRTDSVCLSGRRSKISQNGSTDRSALGSTSSRLEKSSMRVRSRPRSASLNSGRYPIRSSCSRFSSPGGNNDGTARNLYYATSGTTSKPRITRSATLDRKNELPIIREINESTGRTGELRLKVRSMNGSTVFLVHVSADDTVGKLYQLLDRVLARGRTRSYKIIISGYERKRLDQFGIPLREYGISRDSVLHLVND